MLVSNQKIKVSWHNVTRKHYEEKGYVFTKYRDYFYVDAEDLSCGSHAVVKVICDYCGTEINKHYANYLREHTLGKDCCQKCQPKKNQEICMQKYGTTNGGGTPQAKEKAKKTFMNHDNVDNPMKAKEIKDKMIQNSLEKYGVPYYCGTEEFKSKAKNTWENKYGVTNPFASKDVQQKIEQTCLERYGTKHIGNSPEIRQKMRETMLINGTVPVSKPEKEMCELLKEHFGIDNCFPSFPFDALSLDCLVIYNDYKIDFEYDGKYWHNHKKDYDMRRNFYLIRRNFKVVRFVSDINVPTKQDIEEAMNYIVKGNHSLFIKDLDI